MPDGNTGLKSQFGVGDPNNPAQNTPNTQDTGSDKQAQEFQAAFQQEQGVINGHLQYTAANAEAARHGPLSARRDAMFPAFQSALAKIDRKDPSKAQAAIDKVLSDVRALSAEVAAFRQQAEKAKSDWDSRQGKYDEAVHQTEELVAWEDTKAPALRGLVDGIRTQVNQRQYAQATTTLDQLLPKLAPIYEEYLRQKEAKPQYEQQVAEQSARVEALKAADRPSQPMTAKAGEADAAMQQAKGQADTKDFVGGLEQIGTAQAAVDELDTLTNDPQRQQYLADSQAQGQTSEPQPEPLFKILEADWAAISETGAQAQPLADSGDYGGANQALAESKTKRAEFQTKHAEFVQQKQLFDDAQAQLQPRLDALSVSEPQYAKLQPIQQEADAGRTQMEASAQAEDFGQALTQAQDLSAKLDAIEQAKAEIDQKKQAYETLRSLVEPRITQASKKQYLNLAPKLEEIKKLQTQATAAGQAGDFEQATKLMNDASAKTDAYVTACDKEVEPPIMGDSQNARADALMKKLPEADQKAVKALMDSTKSEAEKQYLLKGVAAGHTAAELQAFAKKVEGKDEKWMRDNLSVTGSSTGTGVKQQWSQSCNATAAQAVKAQMDPLYALKLHEENPKLDQADEDDGTKMNPKLAEEQRAGLESEYKGSVASAKGSKGEAVKRKGGGGSGRWADDLLNNQSDTTGVTYATEKDPKIADAMKSIDSGVGKGQPVPIVIGNSAGEYGHYVVVTGMTKGPPKQYTIHDPGSGTTVVRTEADLSGGALNLSGWSRITAIEKPSAKAVK
jgi:hypothetical protein